MKKLILLAIALVIGSANMQANEGEPDVTKEEIRNQIVNLLDSPSHYFEKTTEVKIDFTFDSEGRIIIVKIDTNDYEVKDFFRENLNFKKLHKPGNKLRKYDIIIKLRSL